VLSPFLFIVYMNWIDRQSRVDKDFTVESCRVGYWFLGTIWFCLHLLNKTDIQCTLDWLAARHDHAGIKSSSEKTEIKCLYRHSSPCWLHVRDKTMQQVVKNLLVVFTSDERRNKEIDAWTGTLKSPSHELHRTCHKTGASKHRKAFSF